MISEGRVGPSVTQDGGTTSIRQMRMGGLAVADAHARYFESAQRGYVFSASIPFAGVTSTSTGASPLAAAGVPLIALYNPLNSGRVCAINRAYFVTISGTAAGPVGWNVGGPSTITQATTLAAVPNNGVQTLQPVGRVFGNVALTGSNALIAEGAWAGTTAGSPFSEETAGDIALQPGGVAALVGTGAGTTWIYSASLTWEEVPV